MPPSEQGKSQLSAVGSAPAVPHSASCTVSGGILIPRADVPVILPPKHFKQPFLMDRNISDEGAGPNLRGRGVPGGFMNEPREALLSFQRVHAFC